MTRYEALYFSGPDSMGGHPRGECLENADCPKTSQININYVNIISSFSVVWALSFPFGFAVFLYTLYSCPYVEI